MFEGFANVWTIIGCSDQLRTGQLLPLQIAGEQLVLFREADGRARGLIDRCPHRGVKLSLGRVVDGCVECPFHGWRFAGDGSNQKVPWTPDAKRGGLGAMAVPVYEGAGLLWVYTAPGESAPVQPMVPEIVLDPRVRVMAGVLEWDVHWTRAMENMLDWPHLPFVHRRTIGAGMKMGPNSVMEVEIEDQPYGCSSTSTVDGERRPGGLDYRFPNAMELKIPAKDRLMRFIVACVPIDEGRTRMVFVTARDFLKPKIFDWVFRLSNRRIAGEDRAIVESSSPSEVPPAGEERSVATDRLTLRFRKLYYDRLRGSSAEAGLVSAARLASDER